MHKRTDIRHWVRYAAVTVLLLVGLVVIVLPVFTAQESSASLTDNRARWQASGVTDYDAQVQVSNGSTCPVYTLNVRDGALIDAQVDTPQIDVSLGEAGGTGFSLSSVPTSPIPLSEVLPYTLDGLFDLAAREIAGLTPFSLAGCTPGRVRLDFDEQYGYLRELVIVDYGGMCQQPVCSSDACCPPGVRVLGFTPLPARGD